LPAVFPAHLRGRRSRSAPQWNADATLRPDDAVPVWSRAARFGVAVPMRFRSRFSSSTPLRARSSSSSRPASAAPRRLWRRRRIGLGYDMGQQALAFQCSDGDAMRFGSGSLWIPDVRSVGSLRRKLRERRYRESNLREVTREAGSVLRLGGHLRKDRHAWLAPGGVGARFRYLCRPHPGRGSPARDHGQ
jgi:hypothetical protein